MSTTTRAIVGANGQTLAIVVIPNAAGTTGDAQLVGLTDGTTIAQVDTAGNLRVNVAARGAKTLTTPATSPTAASVLAANTSRKLAVLTNPQSNTATIYIGPSTVTASAYTVALTPGASWVDGDSSDAWYAVSSAGTPTLAVTEIA